VGGLKPPPAGRLRRAYLHLPRSTASRGSTYIELLSAFVTHTGGNAQAVAEICRRLEGLPLAIELAAARVRMLPPNALLARLDQRLGLLTDGPRDLPERQRTLKNTLDWSFDLLSADEQALFMRLGVFAGTFGLPAAEAIWASDAATSSGGAGQVMDTLGSLVDSSLIQTTAGRGEPRFRLLDTIRSTRCTDCARAAAG